MSAAGWILGVGLAFGGTVTPLAPIAGGGYRPLYPADPKIPVVEVAPFRLEVHPVTVGQYRVFVERQPAWAPGKVPGIKADSGYLASWAREVPPADRPVTEVSWYAARAYCQSIGRRLPTEHEWEFVARASVDRIDASQDPAWLAAILAWYSQPSGTPLGPVAANRPNAWGVHDLHGLVWEWVEDFNNTLIASDARESGDADRARFCGTGALSAQNVEDYASFMRLAWRSALEGRTTTRNLGFRCAADPETP